MSTELEQRYVKALETGHTNELLKTLGEGVDVNCMIGQTPAIFTLGAKAPTHIFRLMMEAAEDIGLDINRRYFEDQYGLIHLLCSNPPMIENAKILFEYGEKVKLDVNLYSRTGSTPLSISVYNNNNNNVDCVMLLVENSERLGLNPNLQSSWGNTPLIIACGEGHFAVFEYLLDNAEKLHLDLNLKDQNGNTALDILKMFHPDIRSSHELLESLGGKSGKDI